MANVKIKTEIKTRFFGSFEDLQQFVEHKYVTSTIRKCMAGGGGEFKILEGEGWGYVLLYKSQLVKRGLINVQEYEDALIALMEECRPHDMCVTVAQLREQMPSGLQSNLMCALKALRDTTDLVSYSATCNITPRKKNGSYYWVIHSPHVADEEIDSML